jgi:hypothetical protein
MNTRPVVRRCGWPSCMVSFLPLLCICAYLGPASPFRHSPPTNSNGVRVLQPREIRCARLYLPTTTDPLPLDFSRRPRRFQALGTEFVSRIADRGDVRSGSRLDTTRWRAHGAFCSWQHYARPRVRCRERPSGLQASNINVSSLS